MMKVTRTHRKDHNLWLLGVFPPVTPGLAVGLTLLAAVSERPFPLNLAVFVVTPLVLYIAAGILLLFALDVRIEWHIELANGGDFHLGMVSFAPGASPFDKYSIMLNGQEQLVQRGSIWRFRNRLEFQFAGHSAVVTVKPVALGHRRMFPLVLDVDDNRLAVV